MATTKRSFEIADHLWEALQVMAAEMAVDTQLLVNQALFNLTRMNGYFVPGTVAGLGRTASVAPSSSPAQSVVPMTAVPPAVPVPVARTPAAAPTAVSTESMAPVVLDPDAHPARVAQANLVAQIRADLERLTLPVADRPLLEAAASDEDLGDDEEDEQESQSEQDEQEAQSAHDEQEDEERQNEDHGDEGEDQEEHERQQAEHEEAEHEEQAPNRTHHGEAISDEAQFEELVAQSLEDAHPAGLSGADDEPELIESNEVTPEEPEFQLRSSQRTAQAREADPDAQTMTGVLLKRRLFVTVDTAPPREIVEPRFLIGRDPSCQLVLGSNKLSRQHAVIVLNAEGAHIEDLNSSNGTWFKQQRISRREIMHGDEYRLGEVQLRFRFRGD